ncbi:hypothetical protein [Streptomyces alkaliphilus]|uniref:hypothetical protein n=1 Tax=Streptomyces alkaliphilus TaxID=1472722 RepID=UPI001566D035|nr:hypothetical protein [Streptomyces alkaliphilus]
MSARHLPRVPRPAPEPLPGSRRHICYFCRIGLHTTCTGREITHDPDVPGVVYIGCSCAACDPAKHGGGAR